MANKPAEMKDEGAVVNRMATLNALAIPYDVKKVMKAASCFVAKSFVAM